MNMAMGKLWVISPWWFMIPLSFRTVSSWMLPASSYSGRFRVLPLVSSRTFLGKYGKLQYFTNLK
jgi:hypothetical protein